LCTANGRANHLTGYQEFLRLTCVLLAQREAYLGCCLTIYSKLIYAIR